MEFSVSRRGAAVISLWFILAGAVISVPFLQFSVATTLLCLMAFSLLCLALLAPRIASCRVRMGKHHLTVRKGILFVSTWRLPLRFVTGCHIFRTPLQRLTGTCCMLLYASGSFTLLAGLSFADAETIAAHLTRGGLVL